MNIDNDQIDKLVAGGLIGAGLLAILSKDKEEGALVGAILGAIVAGTLEANKEAINANLPVFVREGDKLIVRKSDGQKQQLKALRRPEKRFPQTFKLSDNGG